MSFNFRIVLNKDSLVLQEGRDELYRYCIREKRTIYEVLWDFGSCKLPLEYLLQIVPLLRPREFSISSSFKMHPGQLHLTMAVVRYKTPLKREKVGLCTHYLSHLDPSKHERVPLWIKPGTMRLPSTPSTPLIMIGPGTGVAPFRSFIQDRIADFVASGAVSLPTSVSVSASSSNPSTPSPISVSSTSTSSSDPFSSPLAFMPPISSASVALPPLTLFFGCRYSSKDFHYQSDWKQYSTTGRFSIISAFSRDQEEKVYVQHRISLLSSALFELIDKQGAVVYVAGSAKSMPTDVQTELRRVVEKEMGVSEEEAEKYIAELVRRGRYIVEAWS